MATYREIHGRSIQAVTTDPTGDVAEGQIWYNTSTDAFKTIVVSEAWASASPTINLTNNGAGAGAQTASLTFGGRNPPGPAFVATTEEYNGSGWTAGGALNTARSYLAGFGTQTAAVAAGGRIDAPGTSTNATEEYNGSSWTTVNNMGTARRVGGDAGIVQTAGLAIGGGPPGVTTTEHYDGTNWTSGGALNTARFYLAGFGTLTSAVAAGGNGGESAVEEYNGSSWTSATSLGTGRTQLGSSGSSETDGIVFGGEAPGPTVKADAESYDGTSWTEGPNLATARRGLSGSSGHSKTAALATAGFPTYNLTEEFTKSVNVITAGAWASASGMNTGRARFGSAGAKDSALAFGGYTVPGNTTNTEKYDGTSWTETGNTPDARNSNTGTGSQTAAMSMSGQDATGGPTTATITFDGSSWSSAPALNVRRQSAAASAASPFNAVVMFGGYGSAPGAPPHIVGATEEYDGSSWTNQTAMPTGVQQNSGGGTQTAAIAAGGYGPDGGSIRDLTQFYDGSSWTTGPATLVAAQQWMGYAGTQTDNFIFGGSSGPASTQTARAQAYDGTAWSTRPSLGTGRYGIRGSVQGTTTSASAFGGLVPSPFTGLTNTEEFTGETTSLNVKTLTQS